MQTILRINGFVLLLAFVIISASREYTWFGSLSVAFLLSIFSSLFVAACRRITTGAVLFAGTLAAVNYADRLKYEELRQHLHHQDLPILFQFIREFEIGFFRQYAHLVTPSLIAATIFVLVLVTLWRFEKPIVARWSRAVLLPAQLAIAVYATGYFVNSPYMTGVRSQLPPRVSADRAPLRLSAGLAALAESLALSNLIAEDRRAIPSWTPNQPPRQCLDCPDVVIVHLESIYDPQMEASYSTMPPLSDLVGAGLEKWSTLIRVHTWGGNSVVTEFELLCSVNHQLFGWGGLQPHVNVAPFMRGCFGNDLKTLGYANSVLYSLNGTFSGVRTAFGRYGYDDFRDFTTLNLPKKWADLHDRIVYEKLFESMRAPRTSPRSYFVSTNWNHGPHGLQPVDPRYPGPYDPKAAGSPALADYVNRLNDSVSALNDLAGFISALPYPVVVAAYGDHHPAFAKNYSPETMTEFNDPDYLTPLMMFRNFQGPVMERVRTINVEETASYISRFAGIAPLPRQSEIRAIQGRCGTEQTACSESDKSRLRAVNLEQQAQPNVQQR